MDSNLNYQIYNFGCKVNAYDGGLIVKNLEKHGFKTSRDLGRIHILNTCAVTAEATKEAARYIRKLKVKDPFCTVVVTGCAAQVDTGVFEKISGADLIIANSHKGELPQILNQYFASTEKQRVYKSDIFKKEDLEPEGGTEKSHTRAFLKIQDGCNSFCTFCVIPFARGKSRSLSIQDLVLKIQSLHSQGFQEVVLTGVHIGDYVDSLQGREKKLEDLIEAVLLKTKIPRIRLTSLEPIEVTPRLLDLYQDSRMCSHFHLSIQSASTEVLNKMKRKYSRKEVVNCLENISSRFPKAFVGMDVIAGFPTETEDQFLETYKTLAENPWTRLHVFPYSSRPGTWASRLEIKVSPMEIQARARRLRELSVLRYEKLAQAQVGEVKKVLVLNPTKSLATASNFSRGLSRDFWPVEIKGRIEHVRGQEIDVRVLNYKGLNEKKMEASLLCEVCL